LIQASGREHLGQQVNGDRNPPTAPDGFNAFHTRQDHPNVLEAMGTYIERYVYDAVGNFLQMQHRGSDPAHAGWTRGYDYAESSLIEDGSGGALLKTSNRLSRTTSNPNGASPPLVEPYQHDAHGNIVRMPHLGGGRPGPNMHWDYKDQLRQTDLGGGGTAFYVFDASGQRVRKVWEKAPGLTEERIYLDGFETFRKHGGAIGANTATLERETLHIMDDRRRIALVEMRTLPTTPDPNDPLRLIRYQFGNHLGSVNLELDEQAQIISYEEYAPYGSSTYQAVRSQTETPKRYRYTGKERDQESGLEHHGARYYAPWISRWVSCDPEGIRDGVDIYQYAQSNPVQMVDPRGTEATASSATLLGNDTLPKTFLSSGSFSASLLADPLPASSPAASPPARDPLRAEAEVIASWTLARLEDIGRGVVRDPVAAAIHWVGAGLGIIGEWFSPSKFKGGSRTEAASENAARFLFFGRETSRWLGGRDLVSADKVQGEWKQNTLAAAFIFVPLASRARGSLALRESAAPAQPGKLSGDPSLLQEKALAAKGGDVGTTGEIEVAKVLIAEGKNVHFQTPVGPKGHGTADFLVGGEEGTGLGGEVTDVFTPITEQPGSVIRGIADKNIQAPNIIVDLRATSVTEWELGDVMTRVRGGFRATNIRSVRFIKTR
jgi:RHS repeat-associated protein